MTELKSKKPAGTVFCPLLERSFVGIGTPETSILTGARASEELGEEGNP